MGLYADYVFPHLLDFVMSRPHMMEQRRRLLMGLEGQVLEIGFGTGLNIESYPKSVERLTVIDPARMLVRRVERRLAKSSIPITKAYVDAQRLPLDDQSFDAVVSTWTLCSIPNVAAALAEVGRVLRPSGRLFFLEHGRSDDPRLASSQDRWNPWQQVIGVGCNMNRPIGQLIEQAGFRVDRLERFRMPKSPKLLAEHYFGQAVPLNKQDPKPE